MKTEHPKLIVNRTDSAGLLRLARTGLQQSLKSPSNGPKSVFSCTDLQHNCGAIVSARLLLKTRLRERISQQQSLHFRIAAKQRWNMKKGLRKVLAKNTQENISQQSLDPVNLEPNSLRDRVYQALSGLTFEERASVSDRLISGLKGFSVNVRTGLLMLGITARTVSDLTPSDVAKLLRYLRINAPKALEAIGSPLRDLLNAREAFEKNSGSLRRAA
jgi:hypothetical protein